MRTIKNLLCILILVLSSCGPAWHLKEAKKHLQKAEALGASVRRDTIFKEIKFDIKGPNTTVDLGDIILHRKDGVEHRLILKDTIIYKDKIRIEVRDSVQYIECPDSLIVEKVPVIVDTDIKHGYTEWQYISAIIGGILFGLVVGFLLGKIIKVGI